MQKKQAILTKSQKDIIVTAKKGCAHTGVFEKIKIGRAHV
jgi:hypothetical protein